MNLLVDGRSIPVAQSGPNFLILKQATQISAGEAELIVSVNGEETKRRFWIDGPVDGTRVSASVPHSDPTLAS